MSNTYSFYIEDNATELKQHINLSESAWLVIEEDIRNFYDSKEKESFSGFLNKIFKHYYQKAEATISLRVLEKKDELTNLYSCENFSNQGSKSINLFIEKLLALHQKELTQKARSYKNGHGEKFRINKENLEILKESQEADFFEGSIGLYLKAIYEEYASKPAYIREQIFFADTINKALSAISRQRKLKVSLSEKVSVTGGIRYIKKFYISPHSIVQDKTNTFNYLIGYSEEIITKNEKNENGEEVKTTIVTEKKPSCFRISRIDKIDIQISMGAHISKENSDSLNKMIIERGVMYMSSEPIDIVVRFTDKGLESFKRQIYMRPSFYTVDKSDRFLYTFRCTEIQAINYFFKFGWDAKIISPDYLNNKFKNRYERALKSYNGLTKEEIFQSEKKNNQ